MKEIERKYLVHLDLFKPENEGTEIRQGYLNTVKERTVRVRIKGDKAFLTIKGKVEGITRPEFEYLIPLEDAQELLNLCEPYLIEKIRYHIQYEGLLWEVDVFKGINEGLVVAEIELESEDQTFEKPDWVGEEVTQDFRYYNSNLTRHPYTLWK